VKRITWVLVRERGGVGSGQWRPGSKPVKGSSRMRAADAARDGLHEPCPRQKQAISARTVAQRAEGELCAAPVMDDRQAVGADLT